MVYLGQRRGLVEGVVLWFLLAHIYSLCTTAPIGVYTVHYLILFTLARLISYGVYANTALSVLSLLFLEAVVSRITLPVIGSSFGAGWSIFSWRNLNLFNIFTNTFLAYLTFGALIVLDKVTFKVARINIEVGEGL